MVVLSAVVGATVLLPVLCAAVLALQGRAARSAARRQGAWWGGTAQLRTASDDALGSSAGVLLVGADGVSWRPVRALGAGAVEPWALGRDRLSGWAVSRARHALVGHVLELHADDGRVVRLDVLDVRGARRALGRLVPRRR